MSPTPRGALSRLYAGVQADLKTAFTGAQQELSFYNETLKRTNNLTPDPEMGGDRHNGGDPTDPAPGLPTVAGGLEVCMDYNQMLWWLYAAFGAPVSSTDDGNGNWTHVFKSGAKALPFLTLDLALRSDFIKNTIGVGVNDMTFGTEKSEGYRKVSLNVIAREMEKVGALTGASQTALPARAKSAGSVGVIRINGVEAGPHIGGQFTYRNDLQAIPLSDGTKYIGMLEPGDRAGEGTLRFRMQEGAGADAIIDTFDDEETPFRLELDWTKSATQSLVIDCPRTFAPKSFPVASNGSAMDYEATFVAAQTKGETPEAMLVVTLKCQTAIAAVTGE